MSIKLRKTLFRSFLRWNKQPAVINSTFILNPSEFGVEGLLPPEMLRVQNKEGVYQAVTYCFKNSPNDSKNIDIAFNCLRKLNELDKQFKKRVSQTADEGPEPIDSPLFKERVEYVNVNAQISETSPTSRQLPLFLLDGAFFPQGRTSLHIFEPRYLQMMEDVANSDELFGYIHSYNGVVAKVGTMCRITNRHKMEDGRQLIWISAVSRFTVTKILDLSTDSYTQGEVEVDFNDNIPETNVDEIDKLEMDVYSSMKYNLRLLKTFYEFHGQKVQSLSNIDKDNLFELKPLLKSTDVSTKSGVTPSVSRLNQQRNTDFSFLLLNIVQSRPSTISVMQSQLLLQTTNIISRLNTIKDLITHDSKLISQYLLKENIITVENKEKLLKQAYADDDDDSDLLTQVEEEGLDNKNE